MATPTRRSRNASALRSFLLLSIFFALQSCTGAIDTLNPDQSITDGQSLVSPGEVFELGFFSPGNSTRRYLGIWFRQVTEQTVVWVANREKPLMDRSGVLKLTSNGSLAIQDGRGNTVWSSSNTSASAAQNATAAMLDTGNLELREGNSSSGSVLWESFDSPCNSFIPKMELYVNMRTGEKRCLTSWRSADDPAAGNFTFCLEPVIIPQMLVWKGQDRYWRSGEWNGQILIGRPLMYDVFVNGPRITVEDGVIRYTNSYFASSEYSRLLLDWDGRFQQMDWDGKEWVVGWKDHYSKCDVYNTCGPFGVCTEFVSSPSTCSCLNGFEPKWEEEWSRGNWSGGCVRRTPLNCSSNEYRFMKLENMKLPDFSIWVQHLGPGDCRNVCSNNCSCVAYAHVEGIGCMVWGRDLLDMEHFPTKAAQDLYLRLASSELVEIGNRSIGGKRGTKTLIIAVPLAVTISVICTCIIFWRTCKRRGNRRKVNVTSLFEMGTRRAAENARLSLQTNSLRDVPMFDFRIVAVATDSFSDANKIGEGGYGPVYRGMLPDGQEIAVKRLSVYSGQGPEQFKNEVMLISRVQHRNLVRLLGCCIEREERMLLYEYMPNKSLDAFLFDPSQKHMLDWERRFKIISGIARGLLYLHQDSRLKIIHRDLKASNILLDGSMNPKISDFGIARIFGVDQILATTNKVIGTYGYMSPEYAMHGRFSEKSDVFSFGVLLLEIVSGVRNTSLQPSKDSFCLLGYAWELWNENKELMMSDSSLECSYPESEVRKCIHIGLLCVQESAADRPTMSTVVFMLGNETASLPAPKQPAFTVTRSDSSKMRHQHQTYSICDSTITVVEGR